MEIQSFGQVDKGNKKRANYEVTHGKEGGIPLDLLDQTIWWGEEIVEKEKEERDGKREKKKEEREAPPFL